MDKLLCRAYFNAHVIDVIELLVAPPPLQAPDDGADASSADDVRCSQRRSSLACCDDGDGALPAAASPDFLGARGGGNVLELIDVPQAHEAGTYGELFAALVQTRQQPLGLYRRRLRGVDGRGVEYVYTNPPSETPLADGDRVYVLSSTRRLMEW